MNRAEKPNNPKPNNHFHTTQLQWGNDVLLISLYLSNSIKNAPQPWIKHDLYYRAYKVKHTHTRTRTHTELKGHYTMVSHPHMHTLTIAVRQNHSGVVVGDDICITVLWFINVQVWVLPRELLSRVNRLNMEKCQGSYKWQIIMLLNITVTQFQVQLHENSPPLLL